MKKVNFGVSTFRARVVNGHEVISEVDPFTKVYNSAANRKLIGSLDVCARSLLLYCFFHSERSTPIVTIKQSKYCKEWDVSDKTFRKAIGVLQDRGILSHKEGDEYFYDYSLFFSGSKLRANIPIIYPYE